MQRIVIMVFTTMNLTALTKYGFRPLEAAYALGSQKLLAECVAAGWIKPVVKRHKLTLYDRADIAKCWTRILAGELPSVGPRR